MEPVGAKKPAGVDARRVMTPDLQFFATGLGSSLPPSPDPTLTAQSFDVSALMREVEGQSLAKSGTTLTSRERSHARNTRRADRWVSVKSKVGSRSVVSDSDQNIGRWEPNR